MALQELARSRPEPDLVAEEIEACHVGSSSRAWDMRRIPRKLDRAATSLSLVAAAYANAILYSYIQTQISSSKMLEVRHHFCRPAALDAEGIFLPRAVLARADDAELHGIFLERDLARLDTFLDASGLRDAWFLVRRRALDATDATFLGATDTFECNRYQDHSSKTVDEQDGWKNCRVFSRVMARAARREPDSFVSANGTEEALATIIHLDKSRIIPIPDEATRLGHFHKDDFAARLGQAARIDR